MENHHHNFKNELLRLNKAIGQLNGIKKMIADHRDCPDILIQLKAVRSAIFSIEKTILSTHLEKCVVESFNDNNIENAKKKVLEIKDLFNKLQN